MTSVSYPTEIEIAGPWLLDARNLADLDELVDSLLEQAREECERQVEERLDEETAEAIAHGQNPKAVAAEREAQRKSLLSRVVQVRKVSVNLSAGRVVHGRAFRELKAVPGLLSEVPRGFRVYLRVGEFEVSVTLRQLYGATIEVTVAPRDSQSGQEAFGRIQNWLADFKPKKWQQFWLEQRHWTSPLLALWVVLFFMVGLSLMTDAPKEDLKAQARQLLEHGIDSGNSTKAIELLLAIESDFTATRQLKSHKPGIRFWAYLVLGILVFLGLRYCPTLEIGLWGGRERVIRARRWLRTISVSIPTIIGGSIVLPWILRILGLSPTY